MLILGIDPGSRSTGYGVIAVEGRRHRLVTHGAITSAASVTHPRRLEKIYHELVILLDRFHPDECAIEMPVYGKNAQAMLKLGRAQAAAMLAAMHREIPVTEYTPKEIKKSVTGNGNAAKEQVNFMVCSLLKVSDIHPHDAADAIAVALCHAHRGEDHAQGRFKDWASFIAANPERVK